jgi:hypothetical protein
MLKHQVIALSFSEVNLIYSIVCAVRPVVAYSEDACFSELKRKRKDEN